MTERKDRVTSKKHIVLTFDICSSSLILEDLHRTENIEEWRNFIIWIKYYLTEKSKSLGFDLYKFTGDGWILLFDFKFSGKDLLNFLENFCAQFHSRLKNKILSILDTPPDILGLTFGMDRGTLVKFIMNRRREYVGRAINVACRLQGAIKDNDKAPQYKILMTSHLFTFLKNDLSDHRCVPARRILRNIAGDKPVNCRKIFLSMSKSNS